MQQDTTVSTICAHTMMVSMWMTEVMEVVVVMMMRERMVLVHRTALGGVGQAEHVGQVLPSLLHAHRAHEGHATLK